jgi:hypothetical protein
MEKITSVETATMVAIAIICVLGDEISSLLI